jgi:long-chain acyl-CoA synthetase
LKWMRERFAERGGDEAIVWGDRSYTYDWLRERIAREHLELESMKAGPGTVVVLSGDYSPRAVALLIAIAERGAIAVPLSPAASAEAGALIELAEAEVVLTLGEGEAIAASRTGRTSSHALYEKLRERGSPGLVLFTSGSTGKPKAVVHDLGRLFEKFEVKKQKLRTMSFLLFDHIGGINTLLYTLSNGGTLVIPGDHDPDLVAGGIARHKVELLPTSPTFLNLLLLSGAHERHDLSSLKLITYGTEPMPESTLARIADALPWVKLQQTYGLSEMGILRSRSRDDRSLWVKLGGEGFETRVVDGMLEVKGRSAMLGYLNAPSPFTADGWFMTGDEVEQDGEWFLIKGRRSEIINVGGQKVYPAEVESVIGLMNNVKDVTVIGEPHPIMGHVVACRVNLVEEEDARELRTRLRKFCRERLADFKVPVKIEITSSAQYNARHKRIRKREP